MANQICMEAGACECDCWSDFERCQLERYGWVTARKSHHCEECRETIARGDRYWRHSGLFDGRWTTTHICVSCKRIAEDWVCDCWQFGTLRETVWELLGVDYVTGETDDARETPDV